MNKEHCYKSSPKRNSVEDTMWEVAEIPVVSFPLEMVPILKSGYIALGSQHGPS